MRSVARAVGLSCMLLLVVGLASPGRSWAGHDYYSSGGRVDYLIYQLRCAGDEDDREDAAEELGKIGDPRALPALREAAARDHDKHVRKDAYKAIRRIAGDYRRYDGPGVRGYGYYQPFPGPPAICREAGPPWPYRPRRRPYWRYF